MRFPSTKLLHGALRLAIQLRNAKRLLIFFLMSKDSVHFEWHLTPLGWVRGNWSANEPLHAEVLIQALCPLRTTRTWLERSFGHIVEQIVWTFSQGGRDETGVLLVDRHCCECMGGNQFLRFG